MANEKRLISLDEAMKATHHEIYWTESQQAAVRAFLVKQTKVDAVEVVRCKDCKMRCPESVCLVKHCTLTGVLVDDDDFCSYGERREGE